MSAVNGNTGQLGFRIKWGNKEIEYFGDSSKDLFRTVFEYVQKNPETGIIESLPIFNDRLGEVKFKGEMPIDSNVDFEGYQRICVDTGVSVEQLQKVLTFQKRPDSEDWVPILTAHPAQRDAIRIVAYALQVGLQQAQIDLAVFKRILSEFNKYPLPDNSLGSILVDFRRSGFVVSSSAVQHRNRPFSLTEEGLMLVRDFIREA